MHATLQVKYMQPVIPSNRITVNKFITQPMGMFSDSVPAVRASHHVLRAGHPCSAAPP